jgi:hypothetical protein
VKGCREPAQPRKRVTGFLALGFAALGVCLGVRTGDRPQPLMCQLGRRQSPSCSTRTELFRR